MNSRKGGWKRIAGLLMALIVGFCTLQMVALAQHQHGGMMPSSSNTTMERTGSFKSRVVEMGEGTIIVEGKYRGKVQRLTLMTDMNTKMEGVITQGSEVNVRYREDPGGMLYATALKGPKPEKIKPKS